MYSNSLPKLLKTKEKCCHLNSNGNDCKNPALIKTYVFGDTESVYNSWYIINLCEKHANIKDLKLLKK